MASLFNPLLQLVMRRSSRRYSTTPGLAAAPLCAVNRAVVEISGPDAHKFLQGFVTNDLDLLVSSPTTPSLYAMMLGANGRALFDVFVYRGDGSANIPQSLLIDCDQAIVANLFKHISIFKLRSKFVVKDRSADFAVYQLADPIGESLKASNAVSPVAGGIDPRFPNRLGQKNRTASADIASQSIWFVDCCSNVLYIQERERTSIIVLDSDTQAQFEAYTTLRYQLGLGEGPKDFPPAACLPLEGNLDLLHGVVWNKGCYLGQELTARTHFTGVIRKRLTPFKFECPPNLIAQMTDGAEIFDQSGSAVGNLRSTHQDMGLGLLRLDWLADPNASSFHIDVAGTKCALRPWVPLWWPSKLPNMPKERLSAAAMFT